HRRERGQLPGHARGAPPPPHRGHARRAPAVDRGDRGGFPALSARFGSRGVVVGGRRSKVEDPDPESSTFNLRLWTLRNTAFNLRLWTLCNTAFNLRLWTLCNTDYLALKTISPRVGS